MIIKRVKSLLEGYDLNIDTTDISADEQKSFANAVAQKIVNNNRVSDVEDNKLSGLLAKSIDKFGFNLNSNPLLQLMKDINGDPKQYKQMPEKLSFLYSKLNEDPKYLDRDYVAPWIAKSSLYKNRDYDGFKYTITAIDFVNDSSKVRQYFNDTSVVKPEEFFYGNYEVDTPKDIYQTIEKWSGNDKKSNTETKGATKTIIDYLIRKKGIDLRRKTIEECVNALNKFMFENQDRKYDMENKDIVNAITKFVKNGGLTKKVFTDKEAESRDIQSATKKMINLVVNGKGAIADLFNKSTNSNKKKKK